MAVGAPTADEASELARERDVEYDANHHDMNMAGLRFFSVYQGFGGNEKHKGQYANTVAGFADTIARSEAPSPSATAREHATHVSDVARACELAAAEKLTGVYNVGIEEGERGATELRIASISSRTRFTITSTNSSTSVSSYGE